MVFFLLCTLLSNPPEDIVDSYVDVVEYNVVFCKSHDNSPRILLVQMVFWREGGVVGWRNVYGDRPDICKTKEDGVYVCNHPGYGHYRVTPEYMLFRESLPGKNYDTGTLRRVRYGVFCETFSFTDSEREDADVRHASLRSDFPGYWSRHLATKEE